MGLFGGDSKTTVLTTTNTLNANLQGTGPAVVGDVLEFSILDAGAIDSAFSAANRVLDSSDATLDAINESQTGVIDLADSLVGQVFGFARDVNERAVVAQERSATGALNFAFEATRPESQAVGQDVVNAAKWTGIAIAVAWGISRMAA